MGNKGAFITLDGKTMKPKYTVYEAVVSIEKYNMPSGVLGGSKSSPRPALVRLNSLLIYYFIVISASSRCKTNDVC